MKGKINQVVDYSPGSKISEEAQGLGGAEERYTVLIVNFESPDHCNSKWVEGILFS